MPESRSKAQTTWTWA